MKPYKLDEQGKLAAIKDMSIEQFFDSDRNIQRLDIMANLPVVGYGKMQEYILARHGCSEVAPCCFRLQGLIMGLEHFRVKIFSAINLEHLRSKTIVSIFPLVLFNSP